MVRKILRAGATPILAAILVVGVAKPSTAISTPEFIARALQALEPFEKAGIDPRHPLYQVATDVMSSLNKKIQEQNDSGACDATAMRRDLARLNPALGAIRTLIFSNNANQNERRRVEQALVETRKRLKKLVDDHEKDCAKRRRVFNPRPAKPKDDSSATAQQSSAEPFDPNALSNRRFGVRARLLRSIVDNAKRTCDVAALQNALAQVNRIINTARARNTSVSEKEDLKKLESFRDEIQAEIDRCKKPKPATNDRQSASVTPNVQVEINAGFSTTGGNNNSIASAAQNGTISGVGETSGGDGFSHSTKIKVGLGDGKSFNATFGASRSKGSSTYRDPNATGYISYVNGNPLVGLGQNGINGRSSFDSLVHFGDIDYLDESFGQSLFRNFDGFSGRRGGGGSGAGGFFSGWKIGMIGGIGLRVQHNQLEENIGFNAIRVSAGSDTKLQTTSVFTAPKFTIGVTGEKEIGKGALFGSLVAVLAPGVTTATGRADQSLQVLGQRANPQISQRATRANLQTSISATLGYTFWGIKAGITGTWGWEANRAYMRMPTGTGGAKLKFKSVHSFAIQAFVRIPLY